MRRHTFRALLGPVAAFTAAGLLDAIAGHAVAQQAERPLSLPTRDVAVLYQLAGAASSGMQKLQVTFADDSRHIRFDYFRWSEATYPFASLIVDAPSRRVISVRPENRSYDETALGNAPLPGALPVPPNASFSQSGSETIAGQTCTTWLVKPGIVTKTGHPGSVCVTDDGVMLRLTFAGKTEPSVLAIAVRYGAPQAGIFEPPADFASTRNGRPASDIPPLPAPPAATADLPDAKPAAPATQPVPAQQRPTVAAAPMRVSPPAPSVPATTDLPRGWELDNGEQHR